MKQQGIFFTDNIQEMEIEAVEFIRKHEPPEGYVLAFSGGKDSIVLYDLAKKANVKFIPIYNATTIDPPELVRFIRKEYPDVIWVRPKISFWGGILKYGCPTHKRRWCCNLLKEEPKNEEIRTLKHKLLGIRAEESWKRANRNRMSSFKNEIHYYPIFYWSSAEIWDYINEHKLKYCELYDLGFKRLGCIPCPLRGKHEQKRYISRYPKYFKLYNKYSMMYYEMNKDKLDYEKFISYLYDIE